MSTTAIIRTAIATTAMLLATATATAAPTASVDASSVAKTSRADNPDQRYCIRTDPETGTRISRTTCQKLADWQDQGVDPRAMRRIR